MELALLPVLAVFQISLCLVSPSASLKDPTLTLLPKHEFFEGEKLTLRCSVPGTVPAGYWFFDQNGKQLSESPANPYNEALLHFTAQRATAGKYSCAYWIATSGKESPSNKSQPISVHVNDAPMAPSFSLRPQLQKYDLDSSVQLVCSAPPQAAVKGFQYFADRIAISALAPSRSSHTYNLSLTTPALSGPYTCLYWVRYMGRNVQSRRSEPGYIHVKARSFMRQLVMGGFFFTLSGLIFLTTYLLMKREDSRRNPTRISWKAKLEEESPKLSSTDLSEMPSPSQPATPPDTSVSLKDNQDT